VAKYSFTIQADTIQELRDLVAKLLSGQPTANGQTGEKKEAPAANSSPAKVECPIHHQAKVNQARKFLYCPTRLQDGTWCSWKSGIK
jgi:hypothetical protein